MKITDWEVEDHGVDNAQYFQGAGVAYTDWDTVATGSGNNAAEAFDDALEQLSQEGYDIPPELEAEVKEYDDGKQIISYITLTTSWIGDNQDVDSSIDSGTEYEVPPKTPEQEFQKDISDEEATITFWGDIGDGAKQILDFCDEENIPITDKAREELEDLSRSGMDSEFYYYISIYVKGDEEEPEESKRKARKVANLAEKLMK